MVSGVDDFPEILQNVFAWNKIFRREFWDQHVGQFPDGLYEDQEATARAYLRSKKFDVLSDVVYEWRRRNDSSQITQQKSAITDLQARIDVIHRVHQLFLAEASPTVYEQWLAKSLGADLAHYYRQVPRVDDEYWQQLQRIVTTLAGHSNDNVWSRLELHERIIARLILEGRRSDAETVLVYLAEHGKSYSVHPHGPDGLRARPGYLPLLKHPVGDDLLRVKAEQISLRSRLTRVVTAASRVTLEGYAYVPGLDLDTNPSELSVRLVSLHSGSSVPLEAQRLRRPGIDHGSKDAWSSYAGSAFTVAFDISALESQTAGKLPPNGAEWFVEMTLQTAGFSWTGTFEDRDRSGAAAVLPYLRADGKHGFVSRFTATHGLSFTRVGSDFSAVQVSLQDRRLALTIESKDDIDGARLVVECPGQKMSGRSSVERGRPAEARIRNRHSGFARHCPPHQAVRMACTAQNSGWQVASNSRACRSPRARRLRGRNRCYFAWRRTTRAI